MHFQKAYTELLYYNLRNLYRKKIKASALKRRTPTLCNYFTVIIDDNIADT